MLHAVSSRIGAIVVHALGVVALSGLPALATGCSDENDSTAGPVADKPAPTPLPALHSAPLTTEQLLVPKQSPIAASTDQDPRVPAAIDDMLAKGFGDLTVSNSGQAVVDWTFDDMPPPASGANPKMLARFAFLADTQLADDESPARLAVFDGPGATNGAFRPQEGHECRILNAAVRTINAINEKLPLDFVLLGGDNSDNAQTNEVDWFVSILDGADAVECDSGADDDPVPGPDNDPKDAFVAEGLKVPWRWVTGNHDVLNQGNFPALDHAADATGDYTSNGARDWRQPGAPVVKGPVAADARRMPLDRAGLLEHVAASGDGHGIDAATKAYGKAYYTFDVASTPLRVLVLDTAAETGGSEGVIHQADVDKFIKPALDKAKADGKWIIMASHHVSMMLSDGTGLGGTAQADALTISAWRTLVSSYDNVLLHLGGHTHVHRVTKEAPTGAHAYWELETSALADYPHQMRVIEVYDQDNGFVSIRAVAFDYSVEGDPVAEDGRARSVVDYTSGWGKQDGEGAPEWRNVELWIAKPTP